MAQDLSKIKKKKELPPIVRKPDDPAALFRSKKDQIAVNDKKKIASKKAAEAYEKAMKEATEPEIDSEKADAEKGLIQQEQLLVTLKAKGEELAKELEETEAGEKRPVKMQLGKNAKQIEKVEEKIAELKKQI